MGDEQVIAFEPKSSISTIGREAFETGADLDAVADAAAADATPYDQEACLASRFQFVGSRPRRPCRHPRTRRSPAARSCP